MWKYLGKYLMFYLFIESQFFLKLLCFLFYSHQTIQLRLAWVQLTIKSIIQPSPVSKHRKDKPVIAVFLTISTVSTFING